MGTERNYARFYCLLKALPGADKETLVSVSYTHLDVYKRQEGEQGDRVGQQGLLYGEIKHR